MPAVKSTEEIIDILHHPNLVEWEPSFRTRVLIWGRGGTYTAIDLSKITPEIANQLKTN